MASRPCKPDADTRRLWQMLMPGVAMPSCGTGETDAEVAEDQDKAAPPAPAPKPPHDKS